MSHARSRMARFVSPAGISSAPVLTDFYREEFLKHRACLALQREYYSERAITDADGAIARVLSELENLCAMDDADQVMSTLLRKFDVVTGLSAWSDPQNYHSASRPVSFATARRSSRDPRCVAVRLGSAGARVTRVRASSRSSRSIPECHCSRQGRRADVRRLRAAAWRSRARRRRGARQSSAAGPGERGGGRARVTPRAGDGGPRRAPGRSPVARG